MVASVLAYLYPSAESLRDYLVQDDGTGPRIVRWNPALGPEPTLASLQATAASAAFQAWLTRDKEPEKTAITQAVAQAVIDLDAYLALSSPTNAQNIALLKKLAAQNKAILKRLAQL